VGVNLTLTLSKGEGTAHSPCLSKMRVAICNDSYLSMARAAVSLSFGEGRGEVVIKVTDNGNGIPQNIVDKIFQPFFTTKPTGQGTGLGLSLSYDIVKAHSGEISVETKHGEGSKFIILLPA